MMLTNLPNCPRPFCDGQGAHEEDEGFHRIHCAKCGFFLGVRRDPSQAELEDLAKRWGDRDSYTPSTLPAKLRAMANLRSFEERWALLDAAAMLEAANHPETKQEAPHA
ncbi:hypothetical protein [Pseudomonas aeruginosa]|uniref:hypothetical protein n=2 Tax=Pseudomonas aeruginosa TaxID=287 RepID=UPI000A7E8A78|nr:hypothetical protein [Pseudomonas aeruginosa]MDK8377627.1 hypothetical protein [Pseudomonas aeruginosa]MQH01568.1 hypothetical protein [Pseudomonas aeruginosa]